MSLDQARIARSFARAQASYASAAQPQRVIAEALMRRLLRLRGSDPVERGLEFGHGSGFLTRALCRDLSPRRLWLNDLVAPCPDCAPAAIPLPGPIEAADLPDQLDLVLSASTLQWIPDPEALIGKLAAQVSPGGWLAITGFAPRHFEEIAALCPGSAAPSLRSARALAAALPPGWQIRDHGTALIRQRFPDAQSLLRHLRATGVNASASRRWTRDDLRAFLAAYEARFRWGDGISLSWNPVWLIAEKGQTSRAR